MRRVHDGASRRRVAAPLRRRGHRLDGGNHLASEKLQRLERLLARHFAQLVLGGQHVIAEARLLLRNRRAITVSGLPTSARPLSIQKSYDFVSLAETRGPRSSMSACARRRCRADRRQSRCACGRCASAPPPKKALQQLRLGLGARLLVGLRDVDVPREQRARHRPVVARSSTLAQVGELLGD